MTSENMIKVSAVLVLFAGPILLGLAGMLRARRVPAGATHGHTPSWNWKLTVMSALLYTLAFNVTFFIQELFLVVPKALTPGLRPTLFHNNHRWEGSNALADLFQGTGVLAIFLSGALCALLLHRNRHGSTAVRLFLVWMAYAGLFMALPQVVIGALSARSDVGMAMAYLDLGTTATTFMALAALILIPTIAIWLGHRLLDLAGDMAFVSSAKARNVFIFKIATLPLLIAILLIIPFRIPREWIEVVMIPVVVTLIGAVWIQAGAWRIEPAKPASGSMAAAVAWPLTAMLLLFLIFQFLLRPGIRFY